MSDPYLSREILRHGAYLCLRARPGADAGALARLPIEKVCANLRDVRRNPEWTFVREGPAWHGRRVASWAALFSAADA